MTHTLKKKRKKFRSFFFFFFVQQITNRICLKQFSVKSELVEWQNKWQLLHVFAVKWLESKIMPFHISRNYCATKHVCAYTANTANTACIHWTTIAIVVVVFFVSTIMRHSFLRHQFGMLQFLVCSLYRIVFYIVCVCVLYCFLFWPAVGKLDTFFATLFLFNVQIFGYRHFERRQLQHSVNCLLQIFSEKVNCRSVQTVCQWSFLFFFFILQASQVNCKVQPIGCIQMVR